MKKPAFTGMQRVSKEGMIRNQPSGRSISGTDVLPTACGCNNRQTSGDYRSRIAIVLKNSAIFWPSVSGNGASPHSQLPPHRSHAYRIVVRRVHHNTRCCRLEKHPSNTAWLVALVPGKLATLLRFVREPPPSSIHSE